ncbi:MAG: transcription termination/antitermination protein NusG [Syntrophales bacterium]
MMFWYVIQTKPRKEGQASSYLSAKGVEMFNPLMENVYVRRGKVIRELKPLFPGYVFGRFDMDESYNLVCWGRGVKKIVGIGDHPAPISDDVIAIIKNRTNKDNIIKKAYQLNPKDRVRIKSGPLKDLIGILERWVSDSARIRVLLNLIGYSPTIELHYSMVEKVY